MKKIKQKLMTSLKSYASNNDGQFAIMGAISMVAILAGLAVAVDISNSLSQKQRLQNTTDAIALIAVRQDIRSQNELNLMAANYLEFNYGEGADGITLNSITRNGDLVTVDATNNVKTYLSGVFNKDALDVRVESTATYTERAAEIALVLDSTGSMSGTKMATLKVAASRLVDTMEATNNRKLRMSVVPFAQYVNVGIANSNADWLDMPSNMTPASWNGCIGSRNGNLDTVVGFEGNRFPAVTNGIGGGGSVSCPLEIRPLTRNFSDVKSTIQGMTARGWTYMPAGLAWGWRTLMPEAPFSEGLPADDQTDKILILMSDGTNTRSKSGTFHNGQSTTNANNKTADICAAVKRDNIRVITIAYEITNTSTINLIRNCATTNADFFDARSSAELSNAFDTIAESLSSLRISS